MVAGPDCFSLGTRGVSRMKRSKKPNSFIKTPAYRGGNAALGKFISENIKYPEEALKHRVEGTVEVAYKVNGLGKVSDVVIVSGIGYGCDEEAKRLVESLVYEKAVTRGYNTSFQKKLKINFHLPPKKKLEMNYTITPAKNKPMPKKPSPPKNTGGYVITVSINPKKEPSK